MKKNISWILLLLFSLPALSQRVHFEVSTPDPKNGKFHIKMELEKPSSTWQDLKMPAWMTGYYQVLDYAKNVVDFSAKNKQGKDLKWQKANHNTWRVFTGDNSDIVVSYVLQTNRSFVALSFLDAARGHISPSGTFLHPDGKLGLPSTLTINLHKGWKDIATGLEPVKNKKHTYYAPDFDVLYDSPLLLGNLDSLPTFDVQGVPHYFQGHKLGNFDKQIFIDDLKKVVEACVGVIGDIPFKHYTFIGIGPGAGGIEHLNSTTVSFSGDESLNTPDGRARMLSFLGHEYFHHYNAKRIRPLELGPFDYDNGSRTRMLWVAEGITTYYDHMLLRWAGLQEPAKVYEAFQRNILGYERTPGKLFQSVTQASYDTWSDGPFGRKGDEVNKTVSYYEKGPVLGWMLDLKIRHESRNKKSLDDVMRSLYYDIYKKQNRGYTEHEFRDICEKHAGVSLEEFFNYVYTVQKPDYGTYLAYAGLEIDTKEKVTNAGWHGIQVSEKNDSLFVQNVDWESPAWREGIRRGDVLLKVNGKKASKDLSVGKKGEIVEFETQKSGKIPLILSEKKEASYVITESPQTSPLQNEIRKSWLKL